MPANQTPRMGTTNQKLDADNMNQLLSGVDKSIGSNKVQSDHQVEPGKPLGRRKNIDRRESDSKASLLGQERREANRRQKKPTLKSAAEKKEETDALKLQQHRKKILLAGCEPVMGFNYDFLAMDDYPENSLVSSARKDRDYWITICGIFAFVFFFGLLGFVPAGMAGISCGLAILSGFFAFSPVRRYFFKRPHLHELLQKRKEIEFRALNHIRLLEGKDGLAWRCAKLKKYNSNLSKNIFSGIFHYSKERQLLAIVRQKKHIRLYLLLMIESQKAYKRLEKDYLENHFNNMENGLDDRIDNEEASKLEQVLNQSAKNE